MLSAHHTISALVVLFIATGCTKKPQENVDLRTQITVASTSQYCHLPDACSNPHILAVENGYVVTVFFGNRPQYAIVRPEALRDHLLFLPMTVWPQGPTILISPTDVVVDSPAVYKNLKDAERVCRSLGLDVSLRPGG